MFREKGEVHSKKANDANMQSPFAMTSRNLHNLFIDRPRDDNTWMKNFTDHYHRPAAGGGSTSNSYNSSTKAEEQVSNTTTQDDEMNNQTISFTLIFLALMIVYLTFCFHYRKLKFRRSYNDDDDDESSPHHLPNNHRTRQRRQRDNQAVLDESSSAANRAAMDGSIEEQRKLEERKRRIGEVLWTRLIVDDDEEEEEERVEEKRGDELQLTIDGGGGGDEENLDNEKSQDRSDFEDEEMSSKNKKVAVMVDVEGRTLAQDENAAEAAEAAEAADNTLATSSGEATIATVPSSSEETTITSNPSNEVVVVPTIGTSPSSLTVAPSTPPSSHFKRYADALSCNSCHHHATNYCSNHHHNINNCSDATTSSNSPAGNSKSSSTSNNNNLSSSLTTITLSEIQQTYGDECNICLSTFQVGDRAAWSKHHFNGCIHVFHDECMKRWLLVRDGCPICRRLYLDEKGTMKQQSSVIPDVDDDDDDANRLDHDEDDNEGGERDLESGVVEANEIIAIEEEEE